MSSAHAFVSLGNRYHGLPGLFAWYDRSVDRFSRTTQSYNESFQQSFSMQTRQLDTIRELLILPNLSSGQQQQMLWGDPTQASLSSDQMTAIASSPAQDGSMELTEATSLDVARMQPSPSALRCNLNPHLANYGKAKRYRSSIKRTYTTVTQTPFGRLSCMITRHGACCSTSGHHDCDAKVETTYTFVPLWWVVKFGVMAFQLDLPQFSTQGWQVRIRAWNV